MENTHENEHLENEVTTSEQEGYVPRPAWQVWAARIGVVIFILLVILQLVNIARGGL